MSSVATAQSPIARDRLHRTGVSEDEWGLADNIFNIGIA
jgi:hypothetical protein